MAVHIQKFHQQSIQGNPAARVDKCSAKDTNKRVVVRDKLIVVVTHEGTGDKEYWNQNPTANLARTKTCKNPDHCSNHNHDNLKIALKSTQAVLLHRLSLIEEHCNNNTDAEENDQENDAHHYKKDVDPLETLDRAIQVVISILASKDWNKYFKERDVKDPEEQKDHVTENWHHIFGIVLSVVEEIVHK